MSDKKTNVVVRNSFPVMGILGVILIVLKLLGVIHLSWLWVLAPFWIPLVISLGFIVFVLVIALIIAGQ